MTKEFKSLKDKLEYLQLLERKAILKERRSAPPKLEDLEQILKDPQYRVYLIEGGRGGGKSWAIGKVLLKILNEEKKRLVCGREIQNSLADSVYKLFKDKIEELEYNDYSVLSNHIEHENGSEIIFKGLRGQGNALSRQNIKSFEGADYFWGEEAQMISQESISVLDPTIRKPGSKIIFTYNRFEDLDPVHKEYFNAPGVYHIKINYYDNPFCPQSIIDKAERLKEVDYDRYLHEYEGEPLTQGDQSIVSRVKCRQAMERSVNADGQVVGGVDVARFGDDRTVIYKRKGLKVTDYKILQGKSNVEVANIVGSMFDQRDKIIVDVTGVGSGVVDLLLERCYSVIPVNFAQRAKKHKKYPNAASEMWFNFANILENEEIELPDDDELLQELTTRCYTYNVKGQQVVEPKDKFKKRLGKSPDKADALILCFYIVVDYIDVLTS